MTAEAPLPKVTLATCGTLAVAAAKLAVEATVMDETVWTLAPLEPPATVVEALLGAGPDGGSDVSTITAPEAGLTGGVVLERVSAQCSAMESAVCWLLD